MTIAIIATTELTIDADRRKHSHKVHAVPIAKALTPSSPSRHLEINEAQRNTS